ncbi:MAG: YeeE/YedE family protein [Ignavibacteriales bacterium]|nr:YeeE/YedE family protein [Ignavibacteriales bacterium]
MNAPFFKFEYFNTDVSLIIAFAIGIAFGIALEKGGFGRATILASQFYFTNMRVLKVMFTAIVTAMLGLYFFSVIGFVDLSLVYLTQTNMLPMVVGGLVAGVGFVIGGYCPGTSVVAFATGKIDAVVYVLGMIFGIFVFGEMFPSIENFFNSGFMGNVTIPSYFNLSYGLVVFLVVLMAIGAFAAAEWGEKKMSEKSGKEKV